jgi:hypothetical protein
VCVNLHIERKESSSGLAGAAQNLICCFKTTGKYKNLNPTPLSQDLVRSYRQIQSTPSPGYEEQ